MSFVVHTGTWLSCGHSKSLAGAADLTRYCGLSLPVGRPRPVLAAPERGLDPNPAKPEPEPCHPAFHNAPPSPRCTPTFARSRSSRPPSAAGSCPCVSCVQSCSRSPTTSTRRTGREHSRRCPRWPRGPRCRCPPPGARCAPWKRPASWSPSSVAAAGRTGTAWSAQRQRQRQRQRRFRSRWSVTRWRGSPPAVPRSSRPDGAELVAPGSRAPRWSDSPGGEARGLAHDGGGAGLGGSGPQRRVEVIHDSQVSALWWLVSHLQPRHRKERISDWAPAMEPDHSTGSQSPERYLLPSRGFPCESW